MRLTSLTFFCPTRSPWHVCNCVENIKLIASARMKPINNYVCTKIIVFHYILHIDFVISVLRGSNHKNIVPHVAPLPLKPIISDHLSLSSLSYLNFNSKAVSFYVVSLTIRIGSPSVFCQSVKCNLPRFNQTVSIQRYQRRPSGRQLYGTPILLSFIY